MFATDAYAVLQAQLAAAVAGLSPAPTVGIGWPEEQALLNSVAKTSNSIVSLYDPGFSRDASRFLLFRTSEAAVPTGITSTVSAPLLKTTVTITLGGTVVANDAVSVVIARGRQNLQAATASAGATDTPITVAAALAAAVNASLSASVSATANGAVVTLTNVAGGIFVISSNVGNIGTRYTETARLVRDTQVDVWAGSNIQRAAVAKAVDQKLTYLDSHFGAQGGTGTDATWVRIRRLSDRFIDDDVNRGLYRWCFRTTLEYGQTYEETVYSVLAFIPSATGTYAGAPT